MAATACWCWTTSTTSRTPRATTASASWWSACQASLHVVIATRRDPPLPLSRMRAGGTLGELRARELRMRPEESRLLIEGHGVSLAEADVRRLHEKTEG